MWWQQCGPLFTQVILPILLIIGLGALVQRFYPMHIPTLSRLNIYVFVPGFLFIRVYESTVSLADMGYIVLAMLIPALLLGVPLYGLLRARQVAGPVIGAVLLGSLVFNAGNFGIPVARLLYDVRGVRFEGMTSGTDGEAVQALVVMFSNLCIWGLGYVILAMAKGHGWQKGALGYLKLPMMYVLLGAFALRWVRTTYCQEPADPKVDALLPGFVYQPLQWIAEGLVPVALLTLGAQLGLRRRWPRLDILGPVLLLKLFGLPAVTAAVVYWLGLWPWPGAEIIIASAAPTAVNTLLLTLELEGDADLAADIVFWTTLASGITVTIVMGMVVAAGAQ